MSTDTPPPRIYTLSLHDALPILEVSRADRIAGKLDDVDALLVTEPANLRYVTGFTGSNGFALVGRDVRRFVTDFRYVEDRKSTRLNSSHMSISYAVFCLKKKKNT